MPKRIQIPIIILSIVLLAGLLIEATTYPGLAAQTSRYANQGWVNSQAGLAQATPSPVQLATVSPTPDAMDDRPVERNPFLIAGGVLIFLVIIFGVWRYSRPPGTEE